MHSVLLATSMAVAGPPATGPVGVEPGPAVGVVWHEHASVTPSVQQALVDALSEAGVERPALVLDASARAVARVALEVPRERAQKGRGWWSALEEAGADYRAGELESAQRGLVDLLDRIRRDPAVPGAADVAWRAQVLLGQLAWAQGDDEGLGAALAAAVALDPGATLSTRRVPPPVVQVYRELRDAVMAERARWPTLRIEAADGRPVAVEIDGVPGLRPVPPGEHLVVVRRPGAAPVGAWLHSDASWTVPVDTAVLDPGLPRTTEAAERICRSVQLRWLMLAREREQRVGLQRYECGQGFAPAWYEQRDGLGPGVVAMLSVPADGFVAEPVLHTDDPWPQIEPEPTEAPLWVIDDTAVPLARQRLRRALPWLLISGVVAGAVTAGVLLGTDPEADVAIDGNTFLRP